MAEQTLGPISFLVVEFKGDTFTGRGFAELVSLVDRGFIRILDLTFVRKGNDGTVTVIEVADLDHDGALDLAVFEGASSGILDESDAKEAAAAIGGGHSAAVLLFENRWATGLVRELRESGAELVAAGYIPQDELAAAVEALGA
jgi:hypothetical protein